MSTPALAIAATDTGTTGRNDAFCLAFDTAAAGGVPLTVLAGHGAEAWSAGPIQVSEPGDGLRLERSAELCMAHVRLDHLSGPDLEARVDALYRRLYRALAEQGTPQVLRVWNYMSHINRGHGDAEQYRRFCVGRGQAMRALGIAQYPAATAIGGGDDDDALWVSCLAGRTAGVPLENPRQTSAFHYPRQYGPTSPGFARAMVLPWTRLLLASGTASVTGHETRWVGDPVAQIGECVTNLRTLVESVGGVFGRTAPVLRVYIRHADDLDPVRDALTGQLPADTAVSYLRGDVCRDDLLVEIEGVVHLPEHWTAPPRTRAGSRFGPLAY